MESGRSVLQMLEATLAALSLGSVMPDDVEFELDMARRQWAVATRDLAERRRLGLEAEPYENDRLAAARSALTRLEASGGFGRSESLKAVLALESERVEEALLDWTVPPPSLAGELKPALASFLASHSAESLVDRLLAEAAGPNPIGVAGGLALAAPAARREWREHLAEVLTDRLHRIGAADVPGHLPALAATAALLEVEQAAEPVFILLLRFRSLLSRPALALCCASLARLGMGWGASTPASLAVASSCAHLLNHCPGLPANSILPLGATALNALSVDTQSVLGELSRAIAVVTTEGRRPPHWQAPLRNLAMALMLRSRLDQFSHALDALLATETGRHFVTLLTEAEALEFVEVNRRDSDFAVRVHSRVMRRLTGRALTATSFSLGVETGSPHFEFFHRLVLGRASPQGRTEVRERLRRNAVPRSAELRL